METPVHKYLKDNNLDKTHWGERIILAEDEGEFSDKDIDDSGAWLSCACGKLDKRIQRQPPDHDFGGTPVDATLRHLGFRFHDYVSYNNFMMAAQSLCQIQTREAKLLSEYETTKKS